MNYKICDSNFNLQRQIVITKFLLIFPPGPEPYADAFGFLKSNNRITLTVKKIFLLFCISLNKFICSKKIRLERFLREKISETESLPETFYPKQKLQKNPNPLSYPPPPPRKKKERERNDINRQI